MIARAPNRNPVASASASNRSGHTANALMARGMVSAATKSPPPAGELTQLQPCPTQLHPVKIDRDCLSGSSVSGPAGYRAEADLNREIIARYGDVPWEQSRMDAADAALETGQRL